MTELRLTRWTRPKIYSNQRVFQVTLKLDLVKQSEFGTRFSGKNCRKKLSLIPLALEQSSHLSSFYGFIKLHPLEECSLLLATASSSSISFSPWPKENDDTDEEIMRTSVKGVSDGKREQSSQEKSLFLALKGIGDFCLFAPKKVGEKMFDDFPGHFLKLREQRKAGVQSLLMASDTWRMIFSWAFLVASRKSKADDEATHCSNTAFSSSSKTSKDASERSLCKRHFMLRRRKARKTSSFGWSE